MSRILKAAAVAAMVVATGAAGALTGVSSVAGAAGARSRHAAPRHTAAKHAKGQHTKARHAKGKPIKLAFVNITSDPQGNAQPDAWDGARAAERYIDRTLGGVDGRPITLTPCNVTNTPESGKACGSKMVAEHPVAVVDGINTVADEYMPALQRANIPYISSEPLSNSEFASPNSFLMGGGTATAGPAFALYSLRYLKAKNVVVAYVDLPPAQVAAESFIQKPLEAKGVNVSLVAVPVQAPDMTPIMNAIMAKNPASALILTPDPQCIGAYKVLSSVSTKIPLFYPANCASTQDIEAGGSKGAEGAYYIVQPGGVPEPSNPDYTAFRTSMKKYFPKTSLTGAAVEGFGTTMDLYTAMKKVHGPITTASVMAALKGAVDYHLWFGSTYTCNGKQMPGLTAICTTQTWIARRTKGRLKKVANLPHVASLLGG